LPSLSKTLALTTFKDRFHGFPGAQIFIYKRLLISSRENTSTMARQLIRRPENCVPFASPRYAPGDVTLNIAGAGNLLRSADRFQPGIILRTDPQ